MSVKYGPLMVDVAATTLSDEDKTILQHPWVGGVILFARNFSSREQVTHLCEEIRAFAGPCIIAVDQEGGRVQRFKEGFLPLPALASIDPFSQAYQLTAEFVAKDLAWGMAQEIIGCGIDLSFAPVLDLKKYPDSIIGDRAFHSEATRVIDLASAYVDGMHEAGMKACGKHFPGHGAVQEDSHHELPQDSRNESEVFADDGTVFRALIDRHIDSLMLAHILYPAIDDKPVGFSSKWVQQILREKFGFKGVIFSDDLSMKGAICIGDMKARVQQSLAAGCDMVLVCNDRDAVNSLLNDEGLDLSPNRSEALASMVARPEQQDEARTQRVRELVEAMQDFNATRT